MAKDITKELAITANFLSVMGGGISMPNAILGKTNSYYELKLRVPGLSPDSLSIDIINATMLIYRRVEEGSNKNFPYLIQQIALPRDVDFEEIYALQKGNELVILMPFNELSGGYYRHIDIRH